MDVARARFVMVNKVFRDYSVRVLAIVFTLSCGCSIILVAFVFFSGSVF